MSYPNKPYINGKLIYSEYIYLLYLKKCSLMTGFVVQGHISAV